MRLTASSIVTNDEGQLLLIQRHDIRTFDVPGGGLEPGELPVEAAVRETFEETGLRVRPSQLLGIYHWPNEPNAYLSFYFHCELLGGRIRPSEETPVVTFRDLQALPKRMLPMHRQRIRHSLARVGQSPTWLTQPMKIHQKLGKKVLGHILFPWQRWQRRRNGQPVWPEPESWKMGAFTIIRNEAGAVLWVKRTDRDVWNLPGGGAENEEPPWETAVRETYEETGCHINLTNLTGVYIKNQAAWIVFAFTAEITSGKLTTVSEAAAFAWFPPGEEPASSLPLHRQRVAHACANSANVLFAQQDGRVSQNI